jgi:hypothetical protein
MKNVFKEYYRPTEEDFQKLWSGCLFALDANVLLNIYGYSTKTREEFLALLERLATRLRMPHQFALEYHRNRAHAIMEQVKNYAKAEKILEGLYESELVPKNKHPFLGDKMLASFNRIRQALAKSRKEHEKLFKSDPYFDRLTVILQGVGKRSEDIEKLREIAKRRYAAKIPPGYADLKEKGEPDAFGDFVGWWQVMEISKSEQKSIIFVTDDAKEDWWHLQGDRTIGPRPELIAEFTSECNEGFYMYSSGQFLSYANMYLKEKVKRGAIREVKDRLKQQFKVSTDKKPADATPPAEIMQKPLFPADVPKSANIKPLPQNPKASSGDRGGT